MMSDKTQEGGSEGGEMRKQKRRTKTAEGHGEKKRGEGGRKEKKGERRLVM